MSAQAIKIGYRAVDGFRKTSTFKTLAGARRYAHRMIGEAPSIGSGYAVSDDGIGRVMVTGCSLAELFPKAWDLADAQERGEADEAGFRTYPHFPQL
jgi:hypothetical protein